MKKKYAYIYTEIDNASDSEASYCSNCDNYLGSYPTKLPNKCPKCDFYLVKSESKIIDKQYGIKRNR